MESIQAIKQRFEIIGNDAGLNRAIEKAIQVAPTDISVLVTGESGVGNPGQRFLRLLRPIDEVPRSNSAQRRFEGDFAAHGPLGDG